MTKLAMIMAPDESTSATRAATISLQNAGIIADHLNKIQHTTDWAPRGILTSPDIYGATSGNVSVSVNPRSGVYTARLKMAKLSLSLRATGATPTAALEALATNLDEHIAECRQALITICKGVTS